MTELPYGRQDITPADVEAVAGALHDRLLTLGPRVEQFEEGLAEGVGARYAVAFNSGTAALHASYFAAGLGVGDAIITSPITFVATANAALYLGAAAELADVDPEHAVLDVQSAEARATERVKLIVPVHFTGATAPMEDIGRLARTRGWAVIEDAAHALGAEYQDAAGEWRRVGACADSAMCCFSFHPVKHITTGEGGAVTTNDPGLRARLKLFRSHGITRDPADMAGSHGPWYYEQQALGFNYRITDFQCALGLSQLGRLREYVERRRALAAHYDRLFADVDQVRPLVPAANCRSAYHLYIVRIPAEKRLRVFEGMRAAGIGVNVHYIPVHRQPYHHRLLGSDVSFPRAEEFYAEALTIPLFPRMTEADVQRVAHELLGLLAT